MNRLWAVGVAVLALVVGGGVVAVGPASAATLTPLVVNFTGDTAGAKANGFASAGVPQVTFYDTGGSGLSVGDLGARSHGNAISASGAVSALEIRLSALTNSLGLAFGNDDPASSNTSDLARLTLFNGLTQVGQVNVNLNANATMDENINTTGEALFNRATFQYVDSLGVPKNLTEVVDDVTVNALCTISGTTGNDTLVGTPGNDVICGDAGNDAISAGAGDDIVYGGAGADTISGGDGADLVSGGSGDDHVSTGAGNDVLMGEVGNDTLSGGAGADELNGSFGNDVLKGGSGKDYLGGVKGNDSLFGGAGGDRVYGGAGTDRVAGGPGRDQISGGTGDDQVFGGHGRDVVAGGTGRDHCNGGPGRDTGQSCELRTRIP
jgi:Ca2+-binding RTX toxin-like protein